MAEYLDSVSKWKLYVDDWVPTLDNGVLYFMASPDSNRPRNGGGLDINSKNFILNFKVKFENAGVDYIDGWYYPLLEIYVRDKDYGYSTWGRPKDLDNEISPYYRLTVFPNWIGRTEVTAANMKPGYSFTVCDGDPPNGDPQSSNYTGPYDINMTVGEPTTQWLDGEYHDVSVLVTDATIDGKEVTAFIIKVDGVEHARYYDSSEYRITEPGGISIFGYMADMYITSDNEPGSNPQTSDEGYLYFVLTAVVAAGTIIMVLRSRRESAA